MFQISDEVKETKRPGTYTRGVATSFGFRKRPETAIPVYTDNSNKLSPDSVDSNGNDDSIESLESSNANVSSRFAPRLPPPKKEPNATRGSRFGFRQTSSARLNRLPESTATIPNSNTTKFKNNNVEKPRAKGGGKTVTISPSVPKYKTSSTSDSTKNKNVKSSIPTNLPTKYTLHSSQLPKPQLPVRVMETKTAKTAANINRKVSTSARSDEGSSKEGSITGDSGVGSQTSGTNGNGDSDTLHGVELLDSSPHLMNRRGSNRPRNLEMMVSGKSFDVRDLDDFAEDGVVTDVAVIPLPRLPSVFANNISTGIVRERTREYQRQLDKMSSTHSFTDDYGEEEKSFRDLSSNEKSRHDIMNKYSRSYQAFTSSKDSSPPSSDEQDWAQGGEAMLDSNIYHFSSSDESRERDRSPVPRRTSLVSPVMDSNIMPLTASYTGAIPKNTNTTSLKSVLLTIEDPFAVVAAKSSGTLLDDETSPQDSLISSFTESEDIIGNSIKKGKSSKSSGSKEVNEKSPLSPTSPGTPTNTSLSLSEGRDFLIDDEIADQPGLMFNETLPVTTINVGDDLQLHSEHNNVNDSLATLVDTPKRLRKYLGASIAASIDTLSPCESIASDDMMMDFEHSQSSGIDDSTDR